MKYYIYTDGSCRNNGAANAVGAWGCLVLKTDGQDILLTRSGIDYNTTNQRMELKAALRACMLMENEFNIGAFDSICIYTDSAYLHNCIQQRWYKRWQMNNWINSKKQPVANRDLWEQLIPYFEDIRFVFHKVPGHQNNKWNNYIDNIVQRLSAEAK